MKKLLLVSVMGTVALALNGCATMDLDPPRRLEATTSVFLDPALKVSGSLAVVAADVKQNTSLEFAHFLKIIGAKLTDYGYSVTDDLSTAGQFAVVSYGIDSGRSEVVSSPLFGQIAGGTTYSSGTVSSGSRFGSYSGSTYTMPQFGVVGASTETVTSFTRVLAIDILDGDSFRANTPKKVLEIRTKSVGTCGTIVTVLPYVIEAAFTKFPGESGKGRVNSVPLPKDFDC